MINNHTKLVQALINGDIGLEQVKERVFKIINGSIDIKTIEKVFKVTLGVAELLEMINSTDSYIRSSKVEDELTDMSEEQYFEELAYVYNQLY